MSIARSLSSPPRRMARDPSGALHRHLQHCLRAQGPWFVAAVFAERAHRIVAPRFVTTVTIVTAVLALTLGWL